MDIAPLTPADLSRELGVDQRTIRVYLRHRHGKLADLNKTRWFLNAEDADDVRTEFSKRGA